MIPEKEPVRLCGDKACAIKELINQKLNANQNRLRQKINPVETR